MFRFSDIWSRCSGLDLLELLHCPDRIQAGEAFQHFLLLVPKALIDIAEGLEFVHHDLKPGNVYFRSHIWFVPCSTLDVYVWTKVLFEMSKTNISRSAFPWSAFCEFYMLQGRKDDKDERTIRAKICCCSILITWKRTIRSLYHHHSHELKGRFLNADEGLQQLMFHNKWDVRIT